MWHAITDCCQNGCWYVVIVRNSVDRELVAYCRDCGAAWRTPEDYDANEYVIGCDELGVIEQPTDEEIRLSTWESRIQKLVSEGGFTSVVEINAGLEKARNWKKPSPAKWWQFWL